MSVATNRKPQRPLRPALLVGSGLLLLTAISHYVGDHISVSGGLGWDGGIYGYMASAFPELLADQGFHPWYVQRLLPSGAVWLVLTSLGKPTSSPYVITGFELLNTAVLLVSVAVWWRLAGTLRLSRRGAAVGYIALFGNFAILKMGFYYPVLTDTAAFGLGLVMVLAYVEQRKALLWAALVAGAFVFPSLVIIGGLLIVLPPQMTTDEATSTRRVRLSLGAAVTALFVIAGATVGWASYGWSSQNWLDRGLLVLGAGLALGFLLLAIAALPERAISALRPRRVLEGLWSRRALLVALGVVAIALSYRYLSANSPRESPLTLELYTRFWYQLSHANLRSEPLPLVFLLAHLVYFGPAFLLIVAWWRGAAASLARLGPGAVLAALATVVMAMNSESRQLIAAWPLFAVALAMTSEERVFPRGALSVLAATSILASKAWLNIPQIEQPFQSISVQIHSFPAQWYFMNQGPWMAVPSYLVQTAAFALLGLLAWWTLKLLREKSDPITGPTPVASPTT